MEALQSLKKIMQSLLQNGYKLPEVLNMTLEDLEIFNELFSEQESTQELTEDFLAMLM
ncbi:Uncharacterised protein [Enterococcus casseliflavus]|uniref:hypothetical protein n=1 Tax=Enterococcus casseliflavus TaxID=37734 RepID=UPI000E00ADC2|nr:hypothetical protein [Enterococcus casseliflavus]GEB30162.1 hypothetical protein ECA02_32570 [Enterococcus casseliflavus]STP33073.1 Uncharacterised protein [Enterococcus casseliflavus]